MTSRDISCPQCGASLRLPREAAGRAVSCAQCKGRFTIAAPSAASREDADLDRFQRNDVEAQSSAVGSASGAQQQAVSATPDGSPEAATGESLGDNWGNYTATVSTTVNEKKRFSWHWAVMVAGCLLATVGGLAAWGVGRNVDDAQSEAPLVASDRAMSADSSVAAASDGTHSEGVPAATVSAMVAEEVSPPADTPQVNDNRRREAVAAEPAPPPIALVAGKPIPGRYMVLARAKITGESMTMEMEGSERYRESMDPPAFDPAAARAEALVSKLGIGNHRGRIEYEVRPTRSASLELEAVLREDRLLGMSVNAYLWIDQAYEILDSNGQVVFRSGGAGK